MKKALIIGITGQDGSYLFEFLLDKGYEVHGVIRRTSLNNMVRIKHHIDKIILHEGNLSDSSSLLRIISQVNRMKSTIWQHKAMYRFLLILLNLLVILMHSAYYVCLRLSDSWTDYENKGIPSFYFRTLRQSGRGSSERNNSLPSLFPLCSCQTIRNGYY